MKSSGANELRSIVALALLFGGAHARAQSPPPAIARALPQVTGPAAQNSAGIGTNIGTNVGANVAAVRIVTQDGKVLSDTPPDLTVQTGKPLDPNQVAESIRKLYRTGDYADLKAIVTPVEDGVRVDFVVREQLFFNQVLIQGLVSPPSDASAAAAMQLTLGQPYRQDAVDEGLARLIDALHDDGLYASEVKAEMAAHPDTHAADIIVHVKSGPRARVKEVQLKNGTEYRDAELLSRLKIKPGQELTSARIERGTDRIRKFLVKKGHLNARASVRRGEYDQAKNVIPLELEVTEGPRVQIAIAGVKISKGQLKKLVPVYQEGSVDVDLLEEGKRNVRERLEREGYFDAEVEYATATKELQQSGGWKGAEEVITYTVERGPRHKLVGIEITGNHYFSRRLVESDRDSLLNLYLSNGFLDAKVQAETLDNYKGTEGALLIRFVIQEGKQTRVASLSIEGNHAFKEEELLSVIASTPGQPYSDYNVASDRDNILALYYNDGSPDARFTATATPLPTEPPSDPRPGSSNDTSAAKEGARKAVKAKTGNADVQTGALVRLNYHIEEGPQTGVKRILVAGYHHTRAGVIRREIRVQPNAPLREGEVVESQRRLYNLGVFNRVTI